MDSDPIDIKATVMPNREVSMQKIAKALQELKRAKLIIYYKGENGETYVHVMKWENHQTLRGDRRDLRFPLCPTAPLPSYLLETDGLPHAGTTKHNVTKQSPTKHNTSPDESFLLFWSVYPKKTNRAEAKRIWDEKQLDKKSEEIMSFIKKVEKREVWREKQYLPSPTNFLRDERWTDDPGTYGKIWIKLNLTSGNIGIQEIGDPSG